MQDVLGKIVTLIIVLGIGYWIVSGIVSEKRAEAERQHEEVKAQEMQEVEARKTQKEEAEKQLQINKSIVGMVAKHNAATDWWQALDPPESSRPVFTFQVQDALTKNDDGSILIFAFVTDVLREADEYSVYFLDNIGLALEDTGLTRHDWPLARIRFTLRSTEDQVSQITQAPRDDLLTRGHYAVIAEIESVEKCVIEVAGEDYEGRSIQSLYFPADLLIVKGRCLDLLYVGNYEILPADFQETGSE